MVWITKTVWCPEDQRDLNRILGSLNDQDARVICVIPSGAGMRIFFEVEKGETALNGRIDLK